MKKKIQFSLVYRDMWQSSGKFQPRKDQLERIAPVIIDMGCFARVETNGGAFEQVNLLAGENPNDAVRAFCKPFNEVGIKTHMLDRGLNALRMYPVPDDVRALMYKVKAKQGTNITRIFDGLNDVRNIIPSIKWAKEGGMTPQCALCITNSPVHTLEYYMNIADQLVAAGGFQLGNGLEGALEVAGVILFQILINFDGFGGGSTQESIDLAGIFRRNQIAHISNGEQGGGNVQEYLFQRSFR